MYMAYLKECHETELEEGSTVGSSDSSEFDVNCGFEDPLRRGLQPEDELRIKWEREQEEYHAKIIEEDTETIAALVGGQRRKSDGSRFLIGGVDISFIKGNNEDACACLSVLQMPDLKLVYQRMEMVKLTQPYIPGFLAFREVPPLESLCARLREVAPQYWPDTAEAQISGLIMSVESLSANVDDVDVSSLSSSVDWREEDYVTKVQDQRLCGSCWTFSSVGAIEGQHKEATDVLIDLSESQLVDCSSDWGNDGCDGGWMQDAFQYVIDVGGIEAEETYPYVPLSKLAFFDRSEIEAKISSYRGVPHGSESALQEAVATIGPVSIALDVGQLSFSFYAGGLYDEPECNTTMLNHGALVVGYGSAPNAQDFWIVKNSWGVDWGNRGYIYMSRNKDNQCGVPTDVCYPLV